MSRRVADDPRIDPRIKLILADWVTLPAFDVQDRDTLMSLIGGSGSAARPSLIPTDRDPEFERLVPLSGLSFRRESVVSMPDGNSIALHVITPEGTGPWPCVFYVHGGGMMVASCFDPNYQAWGRMIAGNGVAVAMVDFRNALRPSSAPEVAPYPAGLNDCLSAFRYLQSQTATFDIDPSRIILAGESGGANLAIAMMLSLKRRGGLDAVKGLYVLCPYLAGDWPAVEGSSAAENAGILMDPGSNFGAVAYGIEAFRNRDPLAWPGFATAQDVAGFPPVVVAVNECDVLRDDGIDFYRLLLGSGVSARCRQAMGTIHGTEIYILCCPDISREAARDIAAFCSG